jgi:hypothetical protein
MIYHKNAGKWVKALWKPVDEDTISRFREKLKNPNIDPALSYLTRWDNERKEVINLVGDPDNEWLLWEEMFKRGRWFYPRTGIQTAPVEDYLFKFVNHSGEEFATDGYDSQPIAREFGKRIYPGRSSD